jgi:VWFA-related protein
MSARILAFAWIALCFPATLFCQTATAPPATQASNPSAPAAGQVAAQAPPVIRTTTREVILDLVVRDKHHHAVTDLKPGEVEIYEDGVRQSIRDFRSIQGSEQLETERHLAGNPAPDDKKMTVESKPSQSSLNSLRQVNFVSVVFAEIAPLNLEFARRAVNEFLKSDNLPNTYVTVYRLGRTLNIVQAYTSDKDLLAKAVDAASKGLNARSGLDLNSTVASSLVADLQANAVNVLANPATGVAVQNQVQDVLANPIPAIVTDPLWAANAASQDASVSLGNALLVQVDLAKALRFPTNMANGMDALDSLRELVRSQAKLPGRKVVLYLADGLTFPADRHDVVDNVIGFANRSGVSFYTVDTRGLNVEDPTMTALAAQRRTGAESVAQLNDPRNGHFEDDDIELTAVASGQLAMREIAESTGGFSVTNTNEISLPMQHIMEDIRTHYELVYAPTSTKYDGHFRKIDVKISRPKISVQTRKGYFAVPDLNGEPLQPYELLALNAINVRPAPVEFPYQIAAMKFRPEEKGVEYEVTFEIPVSGLKTVANAKTGKQHVKAALVAFVHDANGEVVKKVSRELTRDLTDAPSTQLASDRILYAEPVELAAGHYVIDTAVTDEATGKTAVRRVSVFVSPSDNLSLSSLQLVRRFDPLTGPRNPFSPFEIESGRVTPTLSDSASSEKPVSLYFIIYPAKGAAEVPKVMMQVLHDGKEIARKPLTPSQPGADGSIPMLVQLSPGPGQCDVLVTAQEGVAVAQSRLSVRIE